MALIEIATELTQYLEPTKQRAEERIDKLSGIIKETTVKLNQWDSETEGSVEGLNQTRDEQVGLFLLMLKMLSLKTANSVVHHHFWLLY